MKQAIVQFTQEELYSYVASLDTIIKNLDEEWLFGVSYQLQLLRSKLIDAYEHKLLVVDDD